MTMRKRRGSMRTMNKTPLSQNSISFKEEASGKKQNNVKSKLEREHLQNLAICVSFEVAIPSLVAFFGRKLAVDGKVYSIPPSPSLLPC
ncbi:hypothetical protein SLA2020_376940 [Shorea laevis]